MEKNALGVRKGAWTKEEDILLRKCIEKYGEGRWHLVPIRAELNRCRKSCRLRWLNYLRPNIKRGYFTKDEVDLIVRLHKLLGNRWSLIAGRIPGRTANDVKNFWNTNINKKSTPPPAGDQSHLRKPIINVPKTNVIRPRPRSFCRKLPCPNESTIVTSKNINDHGKYDPTTTNKNRQLSNKPLLYQLVTEEEEEEEEDDDDDDDDDDDECMRWWGHLLKTTENENGDSEAPLSFPEDGMTGPIVSGNQCVHRAIDEDYGLSSLDLDIDAWQLVSMNSYDY